MKLATARLLRDCSSVISISNKAALISVFKAPPETVGAFAFVMVSKIEYNLRFNTKL